MPKGVEARFFPVCGSTNTEASLLAVNGQKKPTWIIAGEQTTGRGRQGKTWVSKSGNLYCSLLFSPHLKAADLASLPFLFALCVRDCFILMGCDPADVKCKWPNDVLVQGKKAAGILIETSSAAGADVAHIIVGVGLNLLHSPKEAQFLATSLQEMTGKTVPPREAITILADCTKKRLDAWNTANPAALFEEWSAHAWGLGQVVKVSTKEDAFMATLLGLTDKGGLKVRVVDGEERTIYTADIFPALAGFKTNSIKR